MSHPPDAQLAMHWMAAARRAEIGAALMGIYDRCAAEVAARGPVCWASGRCCNFEKTGHLLYVTGLETAFTLSRVDWSIAETPLAGGSGGGIGITVDGAAVRTEVREAEVPEGRRAGPARMLAAMGAACPFQRANLCGVHTIKPLGCRVYFCDRTAQQWQQGLYERAFAEIRGLHDREGIEYRYGEWRGMLRQVLTAMAD